ncbi:YifB family Mg chelatase-like AAA ATPase [Gilvimarinus sp. F26214L]|uniref:YifB family Mg chelatase-like AAA ATPase n=1 Tax=Gilvimarinus sp. DZF01 TaxID=3461371 RepID=UPI004045D353
MSLALVYTRARAGIDAPLVTVEAHLSNGLPALSIVGLPETAVKESKDRVRSALLNSHFEFPARRITINLAPADLPKEGGRYDLAIALGILAASGQIPPDALAGFEFLGELALSGQLRHIRGALPASMACGREGRALILPDSNAEEAALCRTTRVYKAVSLLEVCAQLHGREDLPRARFNSSASLTDYPDLSEVKGQAQAKRALEVAAAGGHNVLFYGPPGTGKTMLASRLPGILPPLSETEALEAAAIASVATGAAPRHWLQRPFRAPHHSASAAALVGGGSNPRPGEISLAHRGVLFLDELPEFQRQVLEVLREPLESGQICISRANAQVEFPARFQLVAAMNPCPCGYLGAGDDRCRCTPDQVLRYRRKISGPLLDRFDLQVPVNAVDTRRFQSAQAGDESSRIQARVVASRERQVSRQGKSNSELAGRELERVCPLDDEMRTMLEHAMERLGLSARAYHRCLRVARTLADMAGKEHIGREQLAEALSYRSLDRRTRADTAPA